MCDEFPLPTSGGRLFVDGGNYHEFSHFGWANIETEFYGYMDESIQNIKYISIFYYFNPVEYMVNADFAIFTRDIIVLGSINIALIIGSLLIFNKKDIPN